ncbi:hypothetical protein [Paraburkholderia terrae]|nr:hypothetical protein [Paraburkholderia terrae]
MFSDASIRVALTVPVLARMHVKVVASKRELAGCTAPATFERSREALGCLLHAKRNCILNELLTPDVAARDQDDFMNIRTTTRRAPDAGEARFCSSGVTDQPGLV